MADQLLGISATSPYHFTPELSIPQYRVFRARDKIRNRVLAAGRQFGKSDLILVDTKADVMQFSGEHVWIVLPTYRQCKMVMWERLKAMTPIGWLAGKPNESELFIRYRNGMQVSLKGADNADSLRGPGLRSLKLDEYAFMKASVFPKVLQPMLAARRGTTLFAGSPDGRNHYFDLFKRGLDLEQDHWRSWQYTTLQGGNVPADEVARARAELDARSFAQEYEGTFESAVGRIYWAFSEVMNVDATVEYDKAAKPKIFVGLDFNVDPMCAVLGYKGVDETDGRTKLFFFDEIILRNSNTYEMAAAIENRCKPLGVEPPRIEINPDATGRSRKTSAKVGTTDLSILRSQGFRVVCQSTNPPVKDRRNHVNGVFRSADGGSRALFNPRCKWTIASFHGFRSKLDQNERSTGIDDLTEGYDHATDGTGYAICEQIPMAGRGATIRHEAV